MDAQSSHPDRRIIVVDDASTKQPRTDKFPPLTRTGYPEGQKLHSKDGRVYQVESTGAFRRVTPKPLSKKARRKAER